MRNTQSTKKPGSQSFSQQQSVTVRVPAAIVEKSRPSGAMIYHLMLRAWVPLDNCKGQRDSRDPCAHHPPPTTQHITLQLPLIMSALPPLWGLLCERMLRRCWCGVGVRMEKQWLGQLPSTILIWVWPPLPFPFGELCLHVHVAGVVLVRIPDTLHSTPRYTASGKRTQQNQASSLLGYEAEHWNQCDAPMVMHNQSYCVVVFAKI